VKYAYGEDIEISPPSNPGRNPLAFLCINVRISKLKKLRKIESFPLAEFRLVGWGWSIKQSGMGLEHKTEWNLNSLEKCPEELDGRQGQLIVTTKAVVSLACLSEPDERHSVGDERAPEAVCQPLLKKARLFVSRSISVQLSPSSERQQPTISGSEPGLCSESGRRVFRGNPTKSTGMACPLRGNAS
jgi:hypothetical protein